MTKTLTFTEAWDGAQRRKRKGAVTYSAKCFDRKGDQVFWVFELQYLYDYITYSGRTFVLKTVGRYSHYQECYSPVHEVTNWEARPMLWMDKET